MAESDRTPRLYSIGDDLDNFDVLEKQKLIIDFSKANLYKYITGITNRKFNDPDNLIDLNKIKDYAQLLINIHTTGTWRGKN